MSYFQYFSLLASHLTWLHLTESHPDCKSLRLKPPTLRNPNFVYPMVFNLILQAVIHQNSMCYDGICES